MVSEWADVLSRPYPLTAPGRITSLTSDGDSATLHLVGAVTVAQLAGVAADGVLASTVDHVRLRLWVPDRGTGRPEIGGVGFAAVETTPVDGGFVVTADICSSYDVTVAPGASAQGAPPAACPPPAEAVVVPPPFTG